MSEHRRKPPQGRGRRAAQPPPSSSGRRAAAPRGTSPSSYGSRAESRRGLPQGGAAGAAGASGARRARAASGAGGYGGPRGPRGRGRTAPQRKRWFDYPRSDKDGLRRFVPSWKQVLGVCFGFFALLIGVAGIALAMVEVPNPNAAAKQQKNVYYWKDGTQMVVAGGGDHNRQIVPLSQIPKSMQHAVISAENESFYEDSGVDPVGIARAVGKMALGGDTQSGSTITQQYVKNTFLDQSQTLSRKAKELFISIKIDTKMDKDEILAGYLNTAYYGRGAYGIQAAAQAYYGKDSNHLSTSESAFLASTLNGPNMYDPAGGVGSAATKEKNQKRAETRWAWTLKREVETDKLNKSDHDKIIAKKFPQPNPPTKSTELKGQKGYLVDLANNNIVNNPDSHISKRQLEQGGYRVYTTFDKKKMAELEKAVEKVKKENINRKKRKVDKHVQFGGASVKPGDGAIEAIYGGEDATTHFTNNADYTGVQVGSTFKPFVMAAAMRDGVRNPDLGPNQTTEQRKQASPKSVYNGNNKVKLRKYDGTVWHDKDQNEWHQKNDGNENRGMIDLMEAMQFSTNTPFIQLGMDVGTDKVRDAALDAGVNKDSLAKTTPTFSLGTSAPSAIRMANAYATFAESGVRAEPYSVTKVERKGKIAFRTEKTETNKFSPAVADNITNMLETVVQKGTGTTAKALGRPAAGKTGTTDDNKSAWFTGYTPQLSTSIGMWRVNDTAKTQKFLKMYGVGGEDSIHGASFPAEIWTEYMKDALKGEPVERFKVASPIGEKVFGDGASPSPTPTPTETPEETPTEEEPSEKPSDKPSKTEKPDPPEDCPPHEQPCEPDGGQDNGGQEPPPVIGGHDDGGQQGGADQGQADGGANGGDPGGANGGDPGGAGGAGGADQGGWFGGPSAQSRRD